MTEWRVSLTLCCWHILLVKINQQVKQQRRDSKFVPNFLTKKLRNKVTEEKVYPAMTRNLHAKTAYIFLFKVGFPYIPRACRRTCVPPLHFIKVWKQTWSIGNISITKTFHKILKNVERMKRTCLVCLKSGSHFFIKNILLLIDVRRLLDKF